VRLSYGHGVDAALSAAGVKAPLLMAPLMHSIHRYKEESMKKIVHAHGSTHAFLEFHTKKQQK
jgi:hypothetical protein